jgi:Acetyltransferase (GNAT) domain
VIEVEPIALPAEADAWDGFLRQNPGGLVYHSSRYRDLLVDHLGCESEYLVARESGEIRGALPVMWAADEVGRVCNSLPFFGSHGSPVADGEEPERALLDAWNERITDQGTLAATMVANPFLDRQPPPPIHEMVDERISQVTPLPDQPDPDAVLALVESSARRNVRKAERLGFTLERDQSALDELWEIHRENLSAMGGVAKSREFFALIPRHLRGGEDFDLWVARREGEVVAGLLVLYFNRVAEYFTPAVRQDHRSDQPQALILLRAMVHAAGRGCRLWNWGGTWTSQDGVYRFKAKWGARERRYSYFVQVNEKGLLDSTPEELRRRFPHFYVAPFSNLRSTTSAGDLR